MTKPSLEVSVRELKNRLSEYLRRVRAGRELVVTSRGEPVARLVPPEAKPRDPEAEAVARMRALPWVRPGSGSKLKGAKHPIPWKPGDKLASDIVLEDRG